MSDVADVNSGNDDMVTILGDLVNASTTLQSILLGGIEGIERDRALVTFDRSLDAATIRRRLFGDPAETAADPTANLSLSETARPMGMHGFNTAGKV